MISFNKPTVTGREQKYLAEAISNNQLSGDGYFTKVCQKWFEEYLDCSKALLTPSCTAALEMAALLINIQPGDEVIMPSYTFVSTANAFVLRGAKIVFVDIRPDTLNIDEQLIEEAITSNTKAIVPVHYAGVACEMDAIMDIARRHNLIVVEDAAQCIMATYKGRPLGTIGHFGTYSFHATKNITSGGEGGLLIVNDKSYVDRAEIIREKGTNRTKFIGGKIDKYSWCDIGSSYLPSELQAAYLYPQLLLSNEITTRRLSVWERYKSELQTLVIDHGLIELPSIPSECMANGHIFYIKFKYQAHRELVLNKLSNYGVKATSHYEPLHKSDFGGVFEFKGKDQYTTITASSILRLPIYFNIKDDEVESILSVFFKSMMELL